MARTEAFGSLRPGFTLGRVTSGAVGGAAGGLAFGVLMLANFTVTRQVGDAGLFQLLADLLGTGDVAAIWAVHMTTSVLLGVLFSLVVAPVSVPSGILLGLAYALGVMLVGALAILRTLAGEPIRFDVGAAYTLLGHLLYGAVLGAAYVAFHRLEVREALDAQSERWRRWGRREARAEEPRT